MEDASLSSKRIAKNTIMLYFRMLFSMLVSLYTSRVILDALGVEDFGIYNVVGGVVAMFSLLNGSLSAAIQRYITYAIGEGNPNRLRKIFSTSLNILFFIAVCIIFFADTIGLWFLNTQLNIASDRMVAANWVFQISLITFLIGVVCVPYNAALVAYEHFKAFASIGIIEVVFKLVIVILLTLVPSDKLIFYALLNLSVSLIVQLIYTFYCSLHFKECKYEKKIDKKLCKEMFSFSAWNFIGSSAALLNGQGINIVLNIYYGVTVNAARGIAMQISATVSSFVGNFTTAINPQITKSYAQSDYNYMMSLVYKGARFSFLLIFLFAFPIILNAEFVLNLWLRKVPEYTIMFTQLTLLNVLIDSLSTTLVTAMLATGKIALYQIVVGGLLLFNIPISLFFLSFGYPPFTVIVISCVISLLALLVRLIMLRRMLPIFLLQYAQEVLLRTSTVLILASLIVYPFKKNVDDFSFWGNLAQIILSGMVGIIVVVIIGLNTKEKIMIRSKIYSYLKISNKCKH